MNLLVFGAGVNGLTCALTLAQAGHVVEVWAKDLSPKTTSDVAAAFWEPYAAYPVERVTAWATKSFQVFQELEAKVGTGVRRRKIVKYSVGEVKTPEWVSALTDYTENDHDLPPGHKGSSSYSTFVIDMTLYMPFLMASCFAAGIKVASRTIEKISETDTSFDAIINCTGVGARHLLNDLELAPVKGQVVRIKKLEGLIDDILIGEGNHERFSMIVPRENDIVLGGTFEEKYQSVDVDQSEVARIIRDCQVLAPKLSPVEVIGVATAMRPVRTSVRLELEKLEGKNVIHNYGHGGAGITLSWGCADEVSALIEQIA